MQNLNEKIQFCSKNFVRFGCPYGPAKRKYIQKKFFRFPNIDPYSLFEGKSKRNKGPYMISSLKNCLEATQSFLRTRGSDLTHTMGDDIMSEKRLSERLRLAVVFHSVVFRE